MKKKDKIITIVTLLIIGIVFIAISGQPINASNKVGKSEDYSIATATRLNVTETKKAVTQDFKEHQKKAKKQNKKYFTYDGKQYKVDRSYSDIPEYKVTYEFNYDDKDFTTVEIYSDENDIKDTITVYINKNDTSDILTSSPDKTKLGLKILGYITRFFGTAALFGALALIINTIMNREKASKVNLSKQEDTQGDRVDLTKN